jgi:hypothetical protein
MLIHTPTGPSINTYAGLDMPDSEPDLLDFHDNFDAPVPPTSGDLNEESNSEQLVVRPPHQGTQFSLHLYFQI